MKSTEKLYTTATTQLTFRRKKKKESVFFSLSFNWLLTEINPWFHNWVCFCLFVWDSTLISIQLWCNNFTLIFLQRIFSRSYRDGFQQTNVLRDSSLSLFWCPKKSGRRKWNECVYSKDLLLREFCGAKGFVGKKTWNQFFLWRNFLKNFHFYYGIEKV